MSWIKTLSVIAISTLISLLILEVGVRMIFPGTVLYNRFQEPVTYGEFETRRLRPDTRFKHTSPDGVFRFATNAQGFRMDMDVPDTKGPDTLRVLLLGDSHTMGMEVQQDETFAAVLQGRQCGDKVIETINTGVSGSGTSEHLITLEHLLPRLEPDVVVEAFYDNDLDDNTKAFHGLVDGKLTIDRTTHPALKGLKILRAHNNIGLTRYLSQNSYTYSMLMNFVWEKGKQLFYGSDRGEAEQTNYVERVQQSARELEIKIGFFNLILDRMREVTDGKADLYLVGIPSLTAYDLADFLTPENMPILLDVTFEGDKTWHVDNGHRHINAAAHTRIGEAIFDRICPTQ